MRRGFTLVSKACERGFTLIEILVVISLIGILAGLVLVSFTGSQKQARDSQRKSDLKQYQNALEIFANRNNGLYPSITTTSSATTLCPNLGISACPEDSRFANDPTFFYRYQSNGSGAGAVDAASYVLWAKLENNPDYWVFCSAGQAGALAQTGWTDPVSGDCPL